MAISEQAQRNHDTLFPNRLSTLKVTDPELIELFDNWAFDEVLIDGILDTRTRLMVQLSAMIGCQQRLRSHREIGAHTHHGGSSQSGRE
jgi:4-carboxymuconolactone decarboxylase